MNISPLQELLDRLKLSNTGTVYFFSKRNKWQTIISSETAKKLEQIRPTAFYIFNNQPYILFFDFSGPLFQEELEHEIHKKVWSFDQSPLIFILKENDIEIYNAFAYEKKRNKLQLITLGDGQLDTMFSFWSLQSGNAWEWIKEEYYKNTIKQKRVSQKLFDNIKVVRERLTANKRLTDDQANTLILRLIFIRYLIDRNVKLQEEFIEGKTITERRLSFIKLITKPRVLNKFFAELNYKFNGTLFKDIKFELSKDQSYDLAEIFSGEIPATNSLFYGTDFFFEIFDFSIIPVELISGIYESLIDPDTRKLHSAVYTPSFLVEYMLNETIDKYFVKHPLDTECKIFDPATGSGIFLVQAFRRMVEKEIEKDITKKISKVRLRDIVVNNLFGIDLNEQALKVACFSIYIAMLDYIDPASILVSFKFPDLIGINLFAADFFDTDHPYNKKIVAENIEFLLGNPPWKSDKNEHHVNWLKANNKVVGRYEIAQSFLLRSKDFMSHETISALIVTSTIFYNISRTTKIAKDEFLKCFCINTFLDLSPVRRLVFEEKNSPCAILFYHLPKANNVNINIIHHQSVKSNIFLKYFKTLIIEKYDYKQIAQKHFIENDWMFKVALYGNTLDFGFIKKMEKHQSIKKSFKDGIQKRDGLKRDVLSKFKIRNIDEFITEKVAIKKYFTPSKTFSINSNTNSIKAVFNLFGTYKILLKGQTKDESDIVVSYNEGNAVFRNDTFIISSNKGITYLLYCYLITRLYCYYQFLTASTWGIATRPAIRLEEYISFPFAKPDLRDEKELAELADDFLSVYRQFYQSFNMGEPIKDADIEYKINQRVEKIYGVTNFERDLIDYALDVSRYQFQESKQQKFVRKIHNDEQALLKYANVFIDEFEKIYQEEYLRIDVYPLNYFIAINFVFQTEKPLKPINFINDVNDEAAIFLILSANLSISKKAKDLYIQKDIKGFEENSFYIIKPNEYKCWHRAMAWYDVAEVKEAIEASEIYHLKHLWNAS